MERYCRNIVYRQYVGPGALDDEIPRPHVSFDTLRDAAEYVGLVQDKDKFTWVYSIIDVEHLYMGDMLVRGEARHIVVPALAAGRERAE